MAASVARSRAPPSRALGREGLTLTGSPIGRFIAPAGRASIRNTSFARSCSLKMTGGVYSASREMKLTFASIPAGQLSQATATVCPSAKVASTGSGT